MSDITLKSTIEVELPEIARLINDSFEGYVGGDIQFNAARLGDMLAGENISLSLSRVAVRDDEHVGIALIARQGWSSRLALMGITQSAQEKGIGTQFMNLLIDEAGERGDKIYELECIEQNPRGLALYTRCGFEKVQRLLGFSARDPEGEAAELETVDTTVVGKLVTFYSEDLPWQPAGPTIMRRTPPWMAYHLDGAYACLVINTEREVGVISSIFTEPDKRGQGRATRLMRAIFAAHPGLGWSVPAFMPERYAPFMEKLGFGIGEISQFQMRRSL